MINNPYLSLSRAFTEVTMGLWSYVRKHPLFHWGVGTIIVPSLIWLILELSFPYHARFFATWFGWVTLFFLMEGALLIFVSIRSSRRKQREGLRVKVGGDTLSESYSTVQEKGNDSGEILISAQAHVSKPDFHKQEDTSSLRSYMHELASIAQEKGRDSEEARAFVLAHPPQSDFYKLGAIFLYLLNAPEEKREVTPANERMRQLLTELLRLARKHGHSSPEVKEFFRAHVDVPDFRELGAALLSLTQ